MTHKQIADECEALGLDVAQAPDTGRKSYSATGKGIRVYWSTSYEGSLLGLPRLITNGRETHCRSIEEIRYLVNEWQTQTKG